jgi:hypothetical protein
MDRPEYFECRCGSPEHSLRFWLDEDPEFPCIYVSVFLSEHPWYRRLASSIRYLFGHKSMYGHFEEFILHPEDRDRLVELLKKLKVRKAT